MHNKRGKLNQPLRTAGHTHSPSSCTHFFPFNLEVIMANCLSTVGVILLESCQLTDIILLGLQTIRRQVTLLPYLQIYITEYMITSHLNTYYFIPTTITTINQGLNSFKCMIRRASLTSLYRWHFAGILSAH